MECFTSYHNAIVLCMVAFTVIAVLAAVVGLGVAVVWVCEHLSRKGG